MKIIWSKLSPEERDRAVCQAVGIASTKMWRPKNGGLYGSWFDSEMRASNDSVWRNGSWEIESAIFYPKVSTDANEAVKVAMAIPMRWTVERSGGGDYWCEFRHDSRPEINWRCNNSDFSHAICIAALRAKGIEVEV